MCGRSFRTVSSSIQPYFWQTLSGKDLPRLAAELKEAIGDADVIIPTLGLFGNPLGSTEADRETLQAWKLLIDNAHHFGATTIGGFTGRIRDRPIEESLPRYKEVWGELALRAADRGLKIAFENCPMRGDWQTGDWNIAHNPDAWELMFDALPLDNIGLEWEPCHALCYLMDPMPQLRQWAGKIFHVHGKDATVRWEVVRTSGARGREPFAHHRTPGFGDSDWTLIISDLRKAGYRNSIDIEGWHDPVYCEDLEMTGQVYALEYLKRCRGGTYVPNPA